MDGTEAIAGIRALPGGKAVKIVALTASAFEENRRAMFAIGADEFLGKPFVADELLELLRILLGVSYIYANAASPASLKDTSAVTRPNLEPGLITQFTK